MAFSPVGEDDKTQPAIDWLVTRMRSLREARGVTQAHLGAKMKIGHTRISDLENRNNDFKFRTLARYCMGLGIELNKLFAGCPGWGKTAEPVYLVSRKKMEEILASSTSEWAAEAILAELDDTLIV